MNSSSKKLLISTAIILAGFGLIFLLSGFLEENRFAPSNGFEDEDLVLQGATLKGYALGFEGLIADWYWMKSLQYLGDKILKSKEDVSIENLKPLNPRLLYPYLNNATDLDPKFMSVYEFGAIVLPAIDKEQAIKLTEKGIENNPKSWRLYHYLGFTYWRLENYEKAAEIYGQGSNIPDAPLFMKQMAAKMKSEGGSRNIAREMYQQMFAEAQDEQAKDNAARHLSELDSLDERDVINKVLQEFQTKNKRCANTWREILPLLLKEKLPNEKDFRVDNAGNLIDPGGAPYLLDKATCVVKPDEEKTKIPLK